MVEDESLGFFLLVLFYLLNRTKFAFFYKKKRMHRFDTPSKIN